MSEEKTKIQETQAAVPATAAEAPAKPAAGAAAKKPAARTAAKPAASPKVAAKTKTAGNSSAAAAPAPASAKPARKRSVVDETVDKHQKELASALEQAEAIHYDKSKHIKPAAKEPKAAKPVKEVKPAKVRKPKLVRDSFAMPENEYVRIAELKKRLAGEYKKSELLRAGVAVLAALNDAELKAVMKHIERIKTGRPSKK